MRGSGVFWPGVALACALGPALADGVAPAREAEHVRFVQQDGSCHGLTLGGGLGPALTPAALGTISPDALAILILAGRAASPPIGVGPQA